MTFERFMASLYMSAMMQLGDDARTRRPAADRSHWRAPDHRHARLAAGKNQGKPNGTEEHFLQNCLYELRMAYVEVTNALARPPQAPAVVAGSKER